MTWGYDPHANAYDEKKWAEVVIGAVAIVLGTGFVDSQIGFIGDRIPLTELVELDNAVSVLGRGAVYTTVLAVIVWLRGYAFMRWGSYTPRQSDEDSH